MILKHLWSFSIKPVYTPYKRVPIEVKVKVLTSMVLWNLLLGIGLAMLAEGLMAILNVDMGAHRTEDMLTKYSQPQVFLMMVVLAPLIEEIIFRGPLVFYRKSPYFPIAFYVSAVLFGLVHLGNFEKSASLLPYALVIVSPQILMGFFLGFLRVRLGLGYAILMHACHNGLLFLMISISGLQ